MTAEQLIEQLILAGRAIIAVPPAPVAALGDIEFTPGPLDGGFREASAGGLLLKEVASQMEQIPRLPVFCVADPDVEVGVDPAARVQLAELFGSGARLQMVADANRADIGMSHRFAIQRPQEDHTAVAVMLPAVLTVEHDRYEDGRIGAIAADRTSNLGTGVEQVMRRRDRVLARWASKPIKSLSPRSRKIRFSVCP